MRALLKLIVWLLAVLGLGVVSFVVLILSGGEGASTQQLLDSSRELLKIDQHQQQIVTPEMVVPEISINSIRPESSQSLRPIQTENIPSKPPVQPSQTGTEPNAILRNERLKSLDTQKSRLTKINGIQAKLQEVMQQDPNNIDMNTLDSALADLESMGNEEGVIAGVSVKELRSNVKVAAKISLLVKEIEAYSNGTEQIDPKNMMAYVEELQKLQGLLISPTVNNK